MSEQEQQPTFWDEPMSRRETAREQRRNEQTKQLTRVRGKVERWILDFCRQLLADANLRGMPAEFHASDLHAFVHSKSTAIAPASADRVLRLLRRAGLIIYTVENRRSSKYRLISMAPESGP